MTLGVRTFTILGPLLCVAGTALGQVGHTEITKWPQGKRGAVSLTYDDGTVNQFRAAVPIMDRLGFPATFFVITGEIAGSRHRGAFNL